MLVLDFDGVIIDSVDEIVVSTINYLTKSDHRSLAGIPDTYRSLFRLNRPRPRDAAQMVVLGKWCLENYQDGGGGALSRSAFDELAESSDIDRKAAREGYFQTRKAFLAEDPASWLELNPPYYPLWHALRRVERDQFVILTNKNRQAVMQIFEHLECPLLAEQIFAGDDGNSKSENMQLIQERYPAAHYDFVDDAIENLVELQKSFGVDSNVRLFLASWGYVAQDDVAFAREHHIEVLDQETVV